MVFCDAGEGIVSAQQWLEEENAAEVYMYEDTEGFILGPFCINELKLQLEKCALMPVASSFRNRHCATECFNLMAKTECVTNIFAPITLLTPIQIPHSLEVRRHIHARQRNHV